MPEKKTEANPRTFVMDQITKMNVQVRPITKKKKKQTNKKNLKVIHKYTQSPRKLKDIFIFPTESPNFQSM